MNFFLQKKIEKKMLSEYEQQRLQNIAGNNAMLASLGLANGESSLKPKGKPRVNVRKRPPEDDPDSVRGPSTRGPSTRRTNPPERFGELSDAFCLREEIEAECDRPRRERKPVKTYESEQAHELERAQKALWERRKNERQRAALAAREQMEMQRTAHLEWQREKMLQQQQAKQMQQPRQMQPFAPSSEVASLAQCQPRYPTKGMQYTCPHCNGVFVLKKNAKFAADGTVISGFRQHDCVVMRPCIPVMC